MECIHYNICKKLHAIVGKVVARFMIQKRCGLAGTSGRAKINKRYGMGCGKRTKLMI